MKIDTQIVDLGQFFKRKPNKAAGAAEFVDTFFEDFKNLAGSQKGMVISVAEDGDPEWPTPEKFKVMDDKNRTYVQVRVRVKVNYVLAELRKRIKYRYTPKANYIGNGKAILWWKFNPKPKTSAKLDVKHGAY